MSLHFDLHITSRLKSLGRALRDRLGRHADDHLARAAVAPEPTGVARRPEATPSDGVPAIVEVSPSAVTIRASDDEPLSPDQLAYGQDAFHPDAPGTATATDDGDELEDGRTWTDALTTDAIESGPVGRRPLVIDDDGTIR